MKRRILAVVVLLTAGLAVVLAPRLMRIGEENLGLRVEQKLQALLGGRCQVGGLEVLSLTEAELTSVGCVFEHGPLLGVAASRVSVVFASAPLDGALPAVREAAVFGVTARLRGSQPRDTGRSGETRRWLVDGVQRLARLDRRLRELGQRADLSQAHRLAPGGEVRVEKGSLQDESGAELVGEVQAVLRRDGDIALAGVARPAGGGLVGLDARFGEAGPEEVALRVEALPVADRLDRLAGEAAAVRGGAVSGRLTWGEQAWGVDLALSDVLVQADALDEHALPLPTLRGEGELVLGESAELREGRWFVGDTGGEVQGRLELADEPSFRVAAQAQQLPLGRLLAALPEAMLPTTWAEEIRGTLDAEATFSGPVYERSAWDLDWQADFSRLVLASGELARQVERLKGGFEHTFPAAEGEPPIERVLGAPGPDYVELHEIHPHLVGAVLSTEDSGFRSHHGFDEGSLREAILLNLRTGEGRGGSTITQQLAKNLFLSHERTAARKLKEAIIAWRLETSLPKERILELYLNIAEWGPGLFGVQDAADHYFHRTPARLEPEEAAFLASLLPSPVRFHRIYHLRGLTERRKERIADILGVMAKVGRLDKRAYHLARTRDVELSRCSLR